jgi:hypothetical protein
MGYDLEIFQIQVILKITTVLDLIQANDVEFSKLILLGASLLNLSK